MLARYSFGWVWILGLVLILSGCGGGGGGGGGSDGDSCSVPSGLVADAGPNQNVKTGTVVQLDGSKSKGKGGDNPDSYKWSFKSKPDGSRAEFSSTSSAAPQFTPDLDGQYVIQLVIDGVTCDKAVDSVTVTATQTGANSAPDANAGPDQIVGIGDMVNLDGSMSRDPDGNKLNYAWKFNSLPEGSSASLSDASTVSPSFTADVGGTYVVSLQVGDQASISDTDTVKIVAQKNQPPIANAGRDRSISVGSVGRLDGSASRDPDNQLINYNWQITSKPDGSNAQLVGDRTVRPVFQPDTAGTYVISLVTSSGDQSSTPDQVIFTAQDANNSRPVANAGRDQNVQTGTMVELDGNSSRDTDGNNLSYHWTLASTPSGSQTALTGATTATPSFTTDVEGQYVAQLFVDDGTNFSNSKSATDTVVVTASNGNSAPVANAGSDQAVAVKDQVRLDGGDSSDANNDNLNYQWHLVSRPKDSSVSLNDADSQTPTFTADKVGFYVASLTVNDGQADSLPDPVVVRAGPPQLALSVDRSGDGSNYVYLANSGTSNNIRLARGAENALLNRFRLKALGKDFTVSQVKITGVKTDAGETIEPYFDGLSKGTTIDQNDSLDFSTKLRSVPSERITFQVKLQFTVDPGGKKYNFTYNVTVLGQ